MLLWICSQKIYYNVSHSGVCWKWIDLICASEIAKRSPKLQSME